MDYTLRFFKNCPEYTKVLARLSLSCDLQDKLDPVPKEEEFSNIHLPKVAEDVTKTLGVGSLILLPPLLIEGKWDITPSLVKLMFKACTFDFALYNRTDSWCSLFTQEHVLNFEAT